MPASSVMSLNLATGISAFGIFGTVGALSWVIFGGSGAGLRLRTTRMPPATTVMATNPSNDQRTALPITVSSAWASSPCSSGGGVEFWFIESTDRKSFEQEWAANSFHRIAGLKQPGLRMMGETDVWIIFLRRRRGEQQQHRLRPAGRLSAANQFPADAFPLVRNANSQIGQIGDIAKIRQRPRNAGEDFPVPRGDDKIRVAQQCGHSFSLANRPAFAQRRSAIQFDDGIELKLVARFVGNHRTRILQSSL